ncbi:hypothetical protein TTHERM_00310350 (macronuclear) [Tetrahymena thermophila SB210]|uniref:RING-type domain-containing protein n=1 Tax=Tetrahymena thermophila (strain SB210) TaxID=312017 RepID=I7MG08_TETTS|nr:hypothetical protein TTHERM_00310350 [Tetrahymena thermophila SB210]EAS00865.1 hypothetical protein TTHERM_00310350 [Tetrahymena thermophila SB210]|eukprot:XP_001021110.1 hypothetical protein TTHERM_00310350 [Tetrahymena thermophila SB210]
MQPSSENYVEKTIDVKCDSCSQSYDKDNNIPKLLPKCFHTICEQCIATQLHQNQNLICPICKENYLNQFKNLDDFPPNTVILSQMYPPLKKRKLNDESAKQIINVQTIKREETTELDSEIKQLQQQQDLEESTIITKQEHIDEHEPKVLQQLKSKQYRVYNELSNGRSNSSSRSLMHRSGSQYKYRTKESMNEKRKLSQLITENSNNINNFKTITPSRFSENSNSRSVNQSIILQSSFQNSKNFNDLSPNLIQKCAASLKISNNTANFDKDKKNSNFLVKQENYQDHEEHLIDVQKEQQQDQKQQKINSNVIDDGNKHKIKLKQEQNCIFNSEILQSFINSSTENSQDANQFQNQEECNIHNEQLQYYCENHSQGFCIKCYDHSFCENTILYQQHLNDEKWQMIKETVKEEENVIENLSSLQNHYQSICIELNRQETQQIVNIEKEISDIIHSLISWKQNFTQNMTLQTKKIQESISHKLSFIQKSIQNCQKINEKTIQLQKNLKFQLQSQKDILNDQDQSNEHTNQNSQEQFNLSLTKIAKSIDEHQKSFLQELKSFGSQFNKKNLYSINNFENLKNKFTKYTCNFNNYLKLLIQDKQESKDCYIKKIPGYPSKEVSQIFNSIPLINFQ